MNEYERQVGERGRVTIPKDHLADGYRKRAERARGLEAELSVTSTEATERLGDAPGWTE